MSTGASTSVRPVFVQASALIKDSNPSPINVADLCRAAEEAVGLASIFGCQKIAGVFRLYPADETARRKLLTSGFAFGGARVLPLSTNPAFNREGVRCVRVCMSGVPLSVGPAEIEAAFIEAGFKLISKVQLDQARDQAGLLTRFKNGNRSVFVERPTGKTAKTVKVAGHFTGFLFYREREEIEREAAPIPTESITKSTPLPDVSRDENVATQPLGPGPEATRESPSVDSADEERSEDSDAPSERKAKTPRSGSRSRSRSRSKSRSPPPRHRSRTVSRGRGKAKRGEVVPGTQPTITAHLRGESVKRKAEERTSSSKRHSVDQLNS